LDCLYIPGHEIVGYISKVGPNVRKLKIGDRVGVGFQANSCGTCNDCKTSKESYCPDSLWTAGGKLRDGYVTKGGFAQFHRANQNFVAAIPNALSSAEAAPLLCAGITVYTPLKYAKVGPGSKVGIAGIGGLGHLGLRMAKALGAEVYALSTSPSKKEEALRLGADYFINTKDESDLKAHAKSLDMVLNTISDLPDFTFLFGLIKNHGTLSTVGLPESNIQVPPWDLLRNICLTGTLAGSPSETQEMLDFCAKNKIGAQVEILPLEKVNEGFAKVLKNEVRYRISLAVNPQLDQQHGRN